MTEWVSNGDGTSSFLTSYGTITLPDDRLDNGFGDDLGDVTSASVGFHEYSVLTRLGYGTDQMPLIAVQDALNEYPTPFGSYFAGPGFVTHYSPNGNIIINITTDLHALEPGVVQREIVIIDGQYYIKTFGIGAGIMPQANIDLAPIVWGAADIGLLAEVIEYAIENGLGQPVGFETSASQCFAAGTLIRLADGRDVPIESILAGDRVLSYDRAGQLVPGIVVRTFCNQADVLLDVHGLRVTPGHITLSGDGRHLPMIDILRMDGALVTAEGRLMRVAINAPVGSPADAFMHLEQALTAADAEAGVTQAASMRAGTLLFDRNGKAISLLDCVLAQGLEFDPYTGLVAKPDGIPGPLPWFGAVPRPEDYILARSAATLQDARAAVEWQPQSVPQQPMMGA